ncbi:MAG: ABC transporter substrate-binding protein [Dehalococcoidia bacterium]
MSAEHYWSALERTRISRRRVIGGALAAGGGLALAGCGSTGSKKSPVAGTSSSAGPASVGSPTAQAEGIPDSGLPWPYNFPEPNKTAKPGGVMKVAATWDTSILDPTKTSAGGTITMLNIAYNRLIAIRSGIHQVNPFKLNLDGEIAEKWEQPQPNQYIFHLAPNIKYQDVAPLNGRDFTAADVKYAYERYAKEGVQTPFFKDVDSITAADDHTLSITLKQPSADFLVPLASRYLTLFPRELVESGQIEKMAVGTGPMILKDVVQSDHVTMVKFPKYWKKDVLLDGLEFRIMPDASSRLAAFRAGQVDYGYSVVDNRRDLEALLASNPKVQVNLASAVNSTFSISPNLQNPKFQDERVRQALMLAMDRDTLTNVIYGKGLAKTLPTMPWDFVFDKEPTGDQLGPWWHYDPAEAKKLLAAAGAEGLSFDMIYYEYSVAGNTRSNEVLTDQLKQAGITIRPQKVDYTTFNSQWVGGTYKEAADGWYTLGFDANTYFYNQIYSKSPGNRWHINDPQLDEWALKQYGELDAQARRQIQKQMWDRILQKAYRIEKPVAIGFETYQPSLRGIRFTGQPHGANSSYYEWGVQVADAWLDK